ncbi:chymotrypsin-2 [Drosophila elegans]|uniref:chymotrypsin-2 n=1 Tax=Drosophila elegans TaxID=30023 RepID=UPI0007E894B3|nr:chymotrypsin-2 [Drosophila elegans]
MSRWSYLCMIALLIVMSDEEETSSIGPQMSVSTTTKKAIVYRSRYPYVVSIGENLKGYYKHLCVGVIISDEFVLTAAHCIKSKKTPPPRMFVAAGADMLNSQKQTRFFVVEVRWHPKFKLLQGHDIGVLRVFPKFQLDNIRFRSISFTVKPQQESGIRANLIGWGRVKISMRIGIQEIPFQTIENDVCKRKHRFVFLTGTDICAIHLRGSKGPCDGDSGGPLVSVVKEKLYGLLSYGRKACTPLKPYAFTRVSIYSDWIKKTMEEMKVHIVRVNRTRWYDLRSGALKKVKIIK